MEDSSLVDYYFPSPLIDSNLAGDLSNESQSTELDTGGASVDWSLPTVLFTCYLVVFVYAQFAETSNSRFFDCFKIKNNWRLIFGDFHQTLDCLNWMRTFGLLSVISGHSHQIICAKLYRNPSSVNAKHSVVSHLMLQNMNLAVDVFLVLGGLLHAYTWVLKKQKPGNKTVKDLKFWLRLVFNRWYRLAPALGVAMLVAGVFGKVVAPNFWMGSTSAELDCQNTWWSMMSFTNNIFPNSCMRWLWYLAADMQLYFMGLVFLLTSDRLSGRATLFLALSLMCGSNLYRGYIAYVHQIPILHINHVPVWDKFMQILYVKPLPRLTPYVIGLLLGYHLDTAVGFVIRTSKLGQITVATLVPLMYAYVGGFYEYYYDTASSWHTYVYQAMYRSLFALAMVWYALMCTSRHVDFFNRLRKHKSFSVIARLSYSAYLIHPLVIGWFVKQFLFDYAPLSLHVDFVWPLVSMFTLPCVIFCALVFNLVFETPLANLKPVF